MVISGFGLNEVCRLNILFVSIMNNNLFHGLSPIGWEGDGTEPDLFSDYSVIVLAHLRVSFPDLRYLTHSRRDLGR